MLNVLFHGVETPSMRFRLDSSFSIIANITSEVYSADARMFGLFDAVKSMSSCVGIVFHHCISVSNLGFMLESMIANDQSSQRIQYV